MKYDKLLFKIKDKILKELLKNRYNAAFYIADTKEVK